MKWGVKMGKRFTEKYVRELIESEPGYEIIYLNYVNQKSKIKILHKLCSKNFITDLTHWKDRHQRCPHCNKGVQKYTHEQFLKILEERQPKKYDVLEPYINKRTKVKVKCRQCGFIFNGLPSNLFKGICSNCSKNIRSLKFRKNINDIKLPEGYEIFGEYKNNKTPTEIRHKCGTIFISTITNLNLKKRAQRCPKCFSNKSEKETKLADYIESLGFEIEKNKKFRDNENKHKFKEIDIFIRSLGIGIEFDGLYWHSTNIKSKFNLAEKTNYFKKINIPIIHIFEDEWDYENEKIKNYLNDILVNKKIIYTKLDNEKILIDKRWFLNENNIIGYLLVDELPEKEFFLDSSYSKRYEILENPKSSIYDCGYLIYKLQ